MRNDALLRHLDNSPACAALAPPRESYAFGVGQPKLKKGRARSASTSLTSFASPAATGGHARRAMLSALASDTGSDVGDDAWA